MLCIPVAAIFDDQPIEALPFSEQERKLIESFWSIQDNSIKDCILKFSSFAGEK